MLVKHQPCNAGPRSPPSMHSTEPSTRPFRSSRANMHSLLCWVTPRRQPKPRLCSVQVSQRRLGWSMCATPVSPRYCCTRSALRRLQVCPGHHLTCMYGAACTCSAGVLAGQSAWKCRTVCSHVRQRRPRCSSNEAVATQEAVTIRTSANANAKATAAATATLSPPTQHLYNARRPSRYNACSAKQHRDASCHSPAHRASRRLV